MWTTGLFDYVSIILFAFATASAFLLPLAFTHREEARHPALRYLRKKKLVLVLITLGSILAVTAITIAKEIASHPPFKPHSGPGTSQASVATAATFVLELDQAAANRKSIALTHFINASSLFEANDYRRAIPEYRASIAALPTQSAYLNLGIALRFTSAYEDAVAVLATGLKLARDQGNRQFQANFLLQLGAVYFSMGKRSDAEQPYKDAINLFHEEHEEVGEADARLGLAVLYRIMGRPAAADLALEAAKLYKDTGNVLGLANVAIYQGVDKVKTEDCADAFKFFDQALARFTEIKHLVGEARARIAIGSCLAMVGRPAEGENELKAARQLAATSGEREVQVTAVIALAQLLVREQKFAAAAQVAAEALQLGQQIPALGVQEYAHLVLADAAFGNGDLDKGLTDAGEALRIAQETHDAPGKVNALCITGKILLKKAEPANALAPLQQAIDEARSLRIISANVDCLRAFSEALLAVGKRLEGLQARNEADALVRNGQPGSKGSGK